MATAEKLSIALPPEMVGLVRDAVDSGEYASASEVVREALRTWKEQRLSRAELLDELGRAWDAGIASGPGRFNDIEEIKAEARKRLAAAKPK